MFVFSDIHFWQNEPAVQQILVFPDPESKNLFEAEFATRIEKEGIAKACDSRIGAIYKLRAIKNSEGKYVPAIRGGDHALLLWEGKPLDDPWVALGAAMLQMYISIMQLPEPTVSFGDKTRKTHSYIIDIVRNEFSKFKMSESGVYEIA